MAQVKITTSPKYDDAVREQGIVLDFPTYDDADRYVEDWMAKARLSSFDVERDGSVAVATLDGAFLGRLQILAA